LNAVPEARSRSRDGVRFGGAIFEISVDADGGAPRPGTAQGTGCQVGT
jgi:hypothetical protein